MRKFTQEALLAAFEIEQMITDYCHDLDVNDGQNVTQFFTENCIVKVGAQSYKGHAAMKKHYDDHVEAVRNMGGVRPSRHGFINFRVSFPDKGHAIVNFLVIYFSGTGKPPVMNATTPAIVTDVEWECQRNEEGEWHIAAFYGTPMFVGNDSYLNGLLLER